MLYTLRAKSKSCVYFNLVVTIGLLATFLFGNMALAAEPEFHRDVAPILRKYCVACHEGAEAEQGLQLDSFDGLVKGGKKGIVLVAGKPDQSRLLLVLDGRAKPAMPPKDSPAPSAAELIVLKNWIAAGAKRPIGTDPAVGELNVPTIKPQKDVTPAITAAAMLPDGKSLALGSYGEVRLISTESRATLNRLTGLRGNVSAIVISRDGKQLLAAAGEPGLLGEATLFTLPAGEVVRKFIGHRDSLYAAALSDDGKLLATGSYDQQIKVWDVASGRELHTLVGHNGAIFDLAFHPNHRVIASASADRTVKLWDATTGARLETFSQPTREQYAVRFSRDGKRIFAGGADNRIRVWGLSDTFAENTNPLLLTRFAHEGAIIKLSLSSDGKLLASAGEDRTVRLWNAEQVTERLLLDKQSDWVAALAIAPDAKSLVLGRVDGTYALVDSAKGQPIPVAKPELTSVRPQGIERGVVSKLTLSGKHLSGIERVIITSGGKAIDAQVKIIGAGAADQATIELQVPKSQARGSLQLSAVTAGGTTAEVAIQVDDLPQKLEAEPNHLTGRPNDITLPVAIWGAIDSRGDVDQFSFDGKKGQTVVLELSGKFINSQLNGQLVLVDSEGQVVASNNDFDGQSDPLVAYTIPADGRFTVRVHDLTFMGSATHQYRLSIGSFPFVTGVFPTSVSIGRETKLELTGFNLPQGASVSVKPTMAGEMDVPLDGDKFRSLRAMKVLASADTEVVEAEPNDEPAQATKLPMIAADKVVNVCGRIYSKPIANAAVSADSSTHDTDLYRFNARKGQSYILETMASRRGSPIDTKIEVLDTTGKPVERLWLQAVRDSYVTFRPVTSEVTDIRLQNWEEMELNEWVYLQGEVCKIFRMPQGPDSGVQFYNVSNRRRGYFDTSSTAHALDEPAYVVEPHAPGTSLLPNGLPVFKILYANDDESQRQLGSDSRLTFVAPADGEYLVRVSDTRGFEGDRFVYRLTVREAKPDFNVRLTTANPALNAGSAVGLSFRSERLDDFDGDIRIDISGVPTGFQVATPVTIQAGHDDARTPLVMAGAAVQDWSGVKITATATIGGKQVVKEVNGLGTPKFAEAPKVVVRIEPKELTIVPGQTVQATLIIDRKDYTDRVQFSVPNLPHGVIVDNIGLSGILIPEKQSQRTIFLKCAPWVPETDRYFYAETTNVRGGAKDAGSQASGPVLLKVRKGSVVAQGS